MTQGFSILRKVFSDEEVVELRLEAERLAKDSGTACIRHIREKSDLLRNLTSAPKLRDLIPEHYQPVRSILFDKTPEHNWQVAWHQDLTICVAEEKAIPGYGPWSNKDGAIHVQPPREVLENMITLRIHLDDTPATNGALRVIPQSHLLGKLPSANIGKYINEKTITCECSAGDVLLMSPLILHASSRSENPQRRRVIHFEFASPESLHPDLRWHER